MNPLLLFCEFVFENNLDQLVIEPTHHKGNILDLILTNCSKIVHDVKVHSNISCIPTDHFIISSSLKVPNIPLSKTKSQFVYNYRQADFIQLADYLLNCNFEPCLTSYDLDLEYVWSFIKSTIHKAMDLFIPKVKLKQSNAPKWFNTTIRHIHHLRRQAKYRPSTSTHLKLEQSEHELQDVMQVTKAEYESKLNQEFAFSKITEFMSTLKVLERKTLCLLQ